MREREPGVGDNESPVAKWLSRSRSGESAAENARSAENSEPSDTSGTSATPASSGTGEGDGGAARTPTTGRLGRLRSLVSLPVIGALLLGTVLGGAGVLWVSEREDGSEQADGDGFCWGALSEKNVRWFLRSGDDPALPDDVPVRSEESLPHSPRIGSFGSDSPSAHCRLTTESGTKRLDVSVKVLDDLDAYGGWQGDHVHARLTPMAGGLPGMAGPRNAWIVLPTDCPTAKSGRGLVVSVAGTATQDLDERTEPGSPEFAHAAVSVANTVLAEHGCDGRLPVNKEPLRQLAGDNPTARLEQMRRQCGLDLKDDLPDWVMAKDVFGGQLGGPIRVCESRRPNESLPAFRLIAVNDPSLREVILPSPRPEKLRLMTVPCQQYELTFAGEALTPTREGKVPLTKLLRKFAEQEARHRGCDPKKVRETTLSH